MAMVVVVEVMAMIRIPHGSSKVEVLMLELVMEINNDQGGEDDGDRGGRAGGGGDDGGRGKW